MTRLPSSPRESPRLHVVDLVAHLAQPEEDAAAGRLDPAADAALGDGLAGHAGHRVDRARIERRVRVVDPRHLPRACPVVGRGDVDAGADEVLLDELGRVAARDLLELLHRVLLGVDADAALGAAERHVDDRAFVGHERCERLDLVLVDCRRVADAALHGHAVMTVLGAPGGDDLVAAVAPDRELDGVDRVADLDLVEEALRIVGERSCLVEVQVDRLEEAGTRLRHRHGSTSRRESSHADATGA